MSKMGMTRVYLVEAVGTEGKTHCIKFTRRPPTYEQIERICANAGSNSFIPMDYQITDHGKSPCLIQDNEPAYVSDSDIGEMRRVVVAWKDPATSQRQMEDSI
jgi:hypothetical protein